MKDFMIVYEIKDDHEGLEPVQGVSFANDYTEARNKKMDVECGLGAYAELYRREDIADGIPAYVLLEV